MRVMILIEEVATGVRLWYDEGEYYDNILFQWEEGNYSCDCNRAWFFARAGKKPEFDVPCGDDKLYKVICILREDGQQL